MNIIDKRITSQKIADYILDEIQCGHLRKGDHLPTEHELCESLDVSRIPLREALCSLRIVGLLDARQGGGTYVTSECDPSRLGHMLYDFAVLDSIEPVQVLDIRLLLEPEAAALAAEHSDQEQKDGLLKIAQRYYDIAADYHGLDSENRELTALDNAFHQAIPKACGNSFLGMIIQITEKSSTELNMRYFNEKASDAGNDKKRYASEHLKMAKAISKGDAESARRLMEKHLLAIKRAIS